MKTYLSVAGSRSKLHTTSKRALAQTCGTVVVLPTMRFAMAGINSLFPGDEYYPRTPQSGGNHERVIGGSELARADASGCDVHRKPEFAAKGVMVSKGLWLPEPNRLGAKR